MALASLYLCYLPLTEPLVETQVLAYLRGLAADGHEIHLLTFETERRGRRSRGDVRRRLAADGIHWHGLRYHKRPSLLATIVDVACGAALAGLVVRRHRIRLLHVRNHVPAAMALPVRLLTGAGLLFDVRGLMAEEYADGGLWRTGSVAWRLTKWVERRTVARADALVVLTRRALPLLVERPNELLEAGRAVVIPTCADVDRIVAAGGQRETVREELDLVGSRVIVYAGKFSTWYLAEEMARFFARLHAKDAQARFLVLTPSDPELIRRELAAAGLASDTYRIRSVLPAEVGAHLAAADLAISFIAPAPSKAASSPTKIGEYLAAGLPIVVSAGVGDTDELLRDGRVGVVVDSHDDDAYDRAIAAVEVLLGEPDIRARCVEVARRSLSLDRVGVASYRRLYADLERRLNPIEARH